MSSEEDKETKTEEPTTKKLEEARNKGNVPFSREVTSFLMLFMLALTIVALSPMMLRNGAALLSPFILQPDLLAADKAGIGQALKHAAFGGFAVIALPLFGTMFMALAGSFVQNGIMISSESIKPKLEKLSPLKGLKKMFSMRSFVEFLKGILKLIIVAVVAFIAVYPDLHEVRRLPDSTTSAMLSLLAMLMTRIMAGVIIAMFFIAMLDLIYQRFNHKKNLRMSKQEIKDEYKQSEGDPHIKGKLRQLRQERARQRMMQAVPDSDVVITNPTHFAIALRYDRETSPAPILVAKGKDQIALRIKTVAEENNVPVVQNPPLARALFASTDLEEEIPLEHYEAVAKVISYVYELQGKTL